MSSTGSVETARESINDSSRGLIAERQDERSYGAAAPISSTPPPDAAANRSRSSSRQRRVGQSRNTSPHHIRAPYFSATGTAPSGAVPPHLDPNPSTASRHDGFLPTDYFASNGPSQTRSLQHGQLPMPRDEYYPQIEFNSTPLQTRFAPYPSQSEPNPRPAPTWSAPAPGGGSQPAPERSIPPPASSQGNYHQPRLMMERFTAVDPFSHNPKANKKWDNLTFDDIPTAGDDLPTNPETRVAASQQGTWEQPGQYVAMQPYAGAIPFAPTVQPYAGTILTAPTVLQDPGEPEFPQSTSRPPSLPRHDSPRPSSHVTASSRPTQSPVSSLRTSLSSEKVVSDGYQRIIPLSSTASSDYRFDTEAVLYYEPAPIWPRFTGDLALEVGSEGIRDPYEYGSDAPAKPRPPQFQKLKVTWESFIDSVMREWKTSNIITVLLLSAILTILQIDTAAKDPLTRYTALASLICALMSLLFGGMYIVRFGTMRKIHRAAEWSLEAKKTKTAIWWNVWIMLAMPAVWLTWSILLYTACIMSFVWRTGPEDDVPSFILSQRNLLIIRIILSAIFALGVLHGILILATFRRYGDAMDRKWKRRIDGWFQEKAAKLGYPYSYYPYNPAAPASSGDPYAAYAAQPLPPDPSYALPESPPSGGSIGSPGSHTSIVSYGPAPHLGEASSFGSPTDQNRGPLIPAYLVGDLELFSDKHLSKRPDDWRPDFLTSATDDSENNNDGEVQGSPRANPIEQVIHTSLDYKGGNTPPVRWNLQDIPSSNLDMDTIVFNHGRRPKLYDGATAPPSTFLRLYHDQLPWYIDIHPFSRSIIALSDIFTQIYTQLHTPIVSRHYWNDVLSNEQKSDIGKAFMKRTYGDPVKYSRGVCQIDFLGKLLYFEGLVKGPGGMWEMKLATKEEIRTREKERTTPVGSGPVASVDNALGLSLGNDMVGNEDGDGDLRAEARPMATIIEDDEEMAVTPSRDADMTPPEDVVPNNVPQTDVTQGRKMVQFSRWASVFGRGNKSDSRIGSEDNK